VKRIVYAHEKEEEEKGEENSKIGERKRATPETPQHE
jgi:hypothetical protein